MILAREQVAAGIKVLDEKVPGWWRVIDLENLKMQDCTQCMLGQLFGYDLEKAIGARMFGLPHDPNKESWTEEKFLSSPTSVWREIGYKRGLVALGYERGRYIGCDKTEKNGVESTFAQLKCAWAEEIASRRAAEECDEHSKSDEPRSTNLTNEKEQNA